MSMIIRPAKGVFRQTAPLVVIFGAYRRLNKDPQLDAADLSTLTRAVDVARRAHMPLAFCREVEHAFGTEAGVWLSGCLPKVSDRVFDHAGSSAFTSAEFARVVGSITERTIFVVGPRVDSSMRNTVSDASALDRTVHVIIPDHPLQKCSTGPIGGPSVLRLSGYSREHSELSFRNWKKAMLHTEHHL